MSDETQFSLRPQRTVAQPGKVLRLRRIFARLREGSSYDDVAHEEGLTVRRVRQIVAEWLKERPVEDQTEQLFDKLNFMAANLGLEQMDEKAAGLGKPEPEPDLEDAEAEAETETDDENSEDDDDSPEAESEAGKWFTAS
jgi:hypothetical protein